MALMLAHDSRGIGRGLDRPEVDPVGEDVPVRAEHQHPRRTAARVPVGGEEEAAVRGAHGAAGEGEPQQAGAALLVVADGGPGLPLVVRPQRSADLRDATQQTRRREHRRRRGLHGRRPVRLAARAQRAEPHRPIDGGATVPDRADTPPIEEN
jgi:hypothetical protein